MRLTKRQLKRIIREEYARLKRRGLINEMRELAAGAGPEAHFAVVCEDLFNIPCGPMTKMYKLFKKVYDCWFYGGTPAECLAKMDGAERSDFEGDFMSCLAECQHPECEALLEWCHDVEQEMMRMRESRRRRHSLLTEMGQTFDRELEDVEMMIKACKDAGIPISYEEEKEYYESAYYAGHVDAGLYEKYKQCQ